MEPTKSTSSNKFTIVQKPSFIRSIKKFTRQSGNEFDDDQSTTSNNSDIQFQKQKFPLLEIRFSEAIRNLKKSNYISISNIKPNIYLSNSMNRALINLLDTSLKDADMLCSFNSIVTDTCDNRNFRPLHYEPE